MDWIKYSSNRLLITAGAGDIDTLVEPIKEILMNKNNNTLDFFIGTESLTWEVKGRTAERTSDPQPPWWAIGMKTKQM